jgi:hypothetical protein
MYYVIVLILAIIILFVLTKPYRTRRRNRLFEEEFIRVKQLYEEERYDDLLIRLKKTPVLRKQYRLTFEQNMRVMDLEAESLEKLKRTPEAVVAMAHYLSFLFEPHHWPDDLLKKWLDLYNSCVPIAIDNFYFCPHCGLHPNMRALLDYAIERGGKQPKDYPGKGPAVLIEFGGRKKRK